MLSRYFN